MAVQLAHKAIKKQKQTKRRNNLVNGKAAAAAFNCMTVFLFNYVIRLNQIVVRWFPEDLALDWRVIWTSLSVLASTFIRLENLESLARSVCPILFCTTPDASVWNTKRTLRIYDRRAAARVPSVPPKGGGFKRQAFAVILSTRSFALALALHGLASWYILVVDTQRRHKSLVLTRVLTTRSINKNIIYIFLLLHSYFLYWLTTTTTASYTTYIVNSIIPNLWMSWWMSSTSFSIL